MKNANINDLLYLGMGHDKHNVVFLVRHPTFGEMKAHPVKQWPNPSCFKFLMETMTGEQFVADFTWLSPVPRKLGTPKKVKNFVHQKGTKKWMGYDPKRIKSGVKVLCRDGHTRVVGKVGNTGIVYLTCGGMVDISNGGMVDISNGFENYISKIPLPCDIISILDDVYYAGLKAEKEQNIEDKYNGYAPNVWHFWQGGEQPVFNCVINIWLRYQTKESDDFSLNNTDPAECRWYNNGSEWDIVAFKIIGDSN